MQDKFEAKVESLEIQVSSLQELNERLRENQEGQFNQDKELLGMLRSAEAEKRNLESEARSAKEKLLERDSELQKLLDSITRHQLEAWTVQCSGESLEQQVTSSVQSIYRGLKEKIHDITVLERKNQELVHAMAA